MNDDKLPRIGITVGSEKGRNSYDNYVDAVWEAGGRPYYINLGADIPHLLSYFDGFLFTGGTDVHPNNYGAKHHTRTNALDRERDKFELALAKATVLAGKPVLGVCRGMQVLTVAFEGRLQQHVEGHALFYGKDTHSIRLAEGSVLHSLVAPKGKVPITNVNSRHHQRVLDPLPIGFAASAWAEDGTIEGFESVDGQTVAVQWHPEGLDRKGLPIFRYLVARAFGNRRLRLKSRDISSKVLTT